PIRTGTGSVPHPLMRKRGLVGLPRGAYFDAVGNLGHRHVPPMAAYFGGEERVGVDDDNARAVSGARLPQRILKLNKARALGGACAKARRMGLKVDIRDGSVPRVGEQVVEALPARRALKAIDAAESAIIEYHDDELAAKHHGGCDLRIHHEIRTIA